MTYKSPEFLSSHIQSIISFYHPECIDHEFGGYINQMRDDGSIFDPVTKHLVGTCRFIYNYSLASIVLNKSEYKEAAEHGLKFLNDFHQQKDGGFAWVLNGQNVAEGTYYCYGHAFVLLAAAGAKKAGVPGADALLETIWNLLETRFWEPEHQLYVDEIAPGNWADVAPYRGQNANMHMCEAMLAAYEATDESRYLDRAELLAKRICLDLCKASNGLIWEHYHTDWSHDWAYNINDPKNLFKPFGYLPGHFVEWSKLLLILNRHRPSDWLRPKAEFLFKAAMDAAFEPETGAINYTFAPDGTVLDTDQYYWVFSETIGAAALLAKATGKADYWDWYERAWSYADKYFIDHKFGGWYRVLDQSGKKYSDEKSPASKTDYHPLAACYEVLEAIKHS